MNIELTDKEFRRLLDLVYIGNWILNSTREKDRFEDYDILQEKLFAQCAKNGMNALISRWQGHIFPSPAYENGGIHEAIADYEDAVFFDILAEELARRDLGCLDSEPADYTELNARMDEYMDEFEKSGVTHEVLETKGVGVVAVERAVRPADEHVHAAELLRDRRELGAVRDDRLFIRDGHVERVEIAAGQKRRQVLRRDLIEPVGIVGELRVDGRRVAVAELSTKQSIYGFRLRGSHLYSFIERAAARREFHH